MSEPTSTIDTVEAAVGNYWKEVDSSVFLIGDDNAWGEETESEQNSEEEIEEFPTDQNMDEDEVTIEYVMERCVIWGTPDKVADDILAFREEVGDFGTLLYAGKDWVDVELGKKSMILLAEETMPIVNSAIGAPMAAQ